jgi:hypothetical protein
MALKSIEAGRNAGVPMPVQEKKINTNFISQKAKGK